MTIKEMKARLRAIGAEAQQVKEGDTEALNKLLGEAKDLEAKIEEAENRQRLSQMADNALEDGEEKHGEDGEDAKNKAAERGRNLKAGKKVSFSNAISSGDTVMPGHTATDVKPTFNDTSSLIDRVTIVPLPGGESYKRGFEKSNGIGNYTAEGANYNEAEPEFGYAEMTKTKITAYCEEPEEITKLAPSAYSNVIESSSVRAVRKFISRQILIGNGGTGKLFGIFHNPESPEDDIIDRETDIEIGEIDADTLDDIVYAFGGDEDVESASVLILNKKDLQAFARVRKTNGDKAYKIVNHGNTGTIDEIPYIINSACGAISNSDTAEGTYCMAYGPLENYELPVFSDMDVQHSGHYKFRQGQIAHRADIFVGGNVAAYNGFIRVKKAVVDDALDS